jgi:hypothetical protein
MNSPITRGSKGNERGRTAQYCREYDLSETSEQLYAITHANMPDWANNFFEDAATARKAIEAMKADIAAGTHKSEISALILEKVSVKMPLSLDKLVSLLNLGPTSIITKRTIIEVSYIQENEASTSIL